MQSVKDDVIGKQKLQGNPIDTSLDFNHTHFLLVGPEQGDWGAEIRFRSELEQTVAQTSGARLATVVLGGGPGTFKTIRESIRAGVTVWIVAGTVRAPERRMHLTLQGGAADACHIARKVISWKEKTMSDSVRLKGGRRAQPYPGRDRFTLSGNQRLQGKAALPLHPSQRTRSQLCARLSEIS